MSSRFPLWVVAQPLKLHDRIRSCRAAGGPPQAVACLHHLPKGHAASKVKEWSSAADLRRKSHVHQVKRKVWYAVATRRLGRAPSPSFAFLS